jgi:CHASE3 domain sensor protein|tara:strand:+ start:1445 stop:1627 length:183 start_codon:yes stop_codon:yes gene_type:complete
LPLICESLVPSIQADALNAIETPPLGGCDSAENVIESVLTQRLRDQIRQAFNEIQPEFFG